jgi:hypothetical protein
MLVEQYLLFIILGFLLGTFGTMVGTGGGFILVPILLWLYPDWSPVTITSISLAVVAVNSCSGVWAYSQMQRINYRAGIIFAGATIPGAMLGAFGTVYVPRGTFDVFIGLLLIGTCIMLLLRLGNRQQQPQAAAAANPPPLLIARDFYLSNNRLALGAVLSFLIAFLSSLLGISGGIFQVPMLVCGLGVPVHIAVATSEFILAIKGLSAVSIHVMRGTVLDTLPQILGLSLGVVLGAQVGARLSTYVKGSWIMQAVAISIGCIGVSFITTTIMS